MVVTCRRCGVFHDTSTIEGDLCPGCTFVLNCAHRGAPPASHFVKPDPSPPPTPIPAAEWVILTSFVSRMDQIGFQGKTMHTGQGAAVESLLSKRYLFRFYVPDQITALYNVTNKGRALLRDNGYEVREWGLYTKTILNHYAGIKVLKKKDPLTLAAMVEADGFLVKEGDTYELTEAGWKFLGRIGPTDRYNREDVL